MPCARHSDRNRWLPCGFSHRGSTLGKSDDLRDLALPQLPADSFQLALTLLAAFIGQGNHFLQVFEGMILIHNLHRLGIIAADQVPDSEGTITHKHQFLGQVGQQLTTSRPHQLAKLGCFGDIVVIAQAFSPIGDLVMFPFVSLACRLLGEQTASNSYQ